MSPATSLTEQNRAIVEAMFAAANRGDIDGVFALLSEDVTILEPLFMPFGKIYHGKEEFLGLAQILPNYMDVSKITVHYTIADGDRVAACVGITDVATGELTEFIEQFTIRDSKIVENRVFYHNAGSMIDQPKVV